MLLLLAGGVFWTLAYVLIIRRSYLDKCYGMPAVACAANLAWESYYTFVVPFQGIMLYVSACWLVLDLIIFSQVVYYIGREYPNRSSTLLRAFALFSLLVAGFIIHYSHESLLYPVMSAYAQSLLMSGLFIAMLLNRDSSRGQSIYIGLCRLFGTLAVSIYLYLAGSFAGLALMTLLYVVVTLLDMVYVMMLYVQISREGEKPWERF